jgi:hypothetical protein
VARRSKAVRSKNDKDEQARAGIETARIIRRLQSFIHGECEMESAQVTASLALLKKTLPDLSAVDRDGDAGLRHEDSLAQLDGPRARYPAKTAR